MDSNYYYVDKTEQIEKGIAEFPSVYIEGAAACGKSVAIEMLLKKHPEATAVVLDGNDSGKVKGFLESTNEDQVTAENIPTWIIIEDLSGNTDAQLINMLRTFIRKMPIHYKVFMISREKPVPELLDLLWKRKMALVSQESLHFTREEISVFAEYMGSMLDPEDLFAETAGWAGCVEVMVRLSMEKAHVDKKVSDIKKCYEIDAFIRTHILDGISEEEKRVLAYAAVCPWIQPELCEDIWKMSNSKDALEDLTRKGILTFDRQQGFWRLSSMFREMDVRSLEISWDLLGEWYEIRGFIREALECYRRLEDLVLYKKCIITNYKKVPFLGIDYGMVGQYDDCLPQICYLRGSYCYSQRDFKGIEREIKRLEKVTFDSRDDGNTLEHLRKEVLLNLKFLVPEITLDMWLEALCAEVPERFSVYGILESSHTCLCGLRDLSGLFSCSKKEENRRAKIWREGLGEDEWRCYRLARIDYYLETERQKAVSQEDWQMVQSGNDLSCLYIMMKQQRRWPEEQRAEVIRSLEQRLIHQDNQILASNADALASLYSPWMQQAQRLTMWLHKSDEQAKTEVSESNYIQLICLSKGYLLLNQYEKVKRILRRLIPYLREYRRGRLLAEALFQNAIIYWSMGKHGQALQNTIESFLISKEYRYVDLYVSYGKKGKVLLEAYIAWMQTNEPERWHRKKKYQYGNVLRMQEADYTEMVMRCIKRYSGTGEAFSEEFTGEHLTMMETIILQNIESGLSNAQICQTLNLKLPTVKTHIYSLYKKLGVNNRVQAILKAKERGILS